MPTAIIIPTLGAPTCNGFALAVRPLADFAHDTDADLADDYERNLHRCIRAIRDGFVLCLRPTAGRPASTGLRPHMAADALIGAEAPRFLVVDPYDAEGEDIRDRAPASAAA